MNNRNSKVEKVNFVALLPRKPSQHFVKVFQSNSFNDALRSSDNPRKGTSEDHCVPSVFQGSK